VKQGDLEWFRPLWRRVAVTVVCAAWCAFEWYHGDEIWSWLTTALVAYAVWTFFITFDRNVSKGGGDGKPEA